ncbi:helix-turn-helix domain-containing protein [Asticcacaulis endophyticus]|uniref:Transcriptional regulator n=1 Tax=Asticcacaulis endophyticus TaxID=1395890 RepID=A0A918Q3N8_9CAUL|nr:helix-turn-helix domain-containing protein [Asticcacaulis endophyticus]GGZ32774.1 transcriptional regulator [Asticcacaulis endophyticus]
MGIPPDEHQPHFVDIHVGAQMRKWRKLRGFSQERLADKIGVSFQQVQKYERGGNRISASKLYEIAVVLDLEPTVFYQGLREGGSLADFAISFSASDVRAFLVSREGIALAQAFPAVKDAKCRRKLLELIEALAGENLTRAASGLD